MFANQRVLFVTGKGGTGKSTIAAAIALRENRAGRRVLLVDVEAKGDSTRLLGGRPPLYTAREIRPGLSSLALHAEETLDEYIRLQIKLPRLARFGPAAKVLDFIATAAPGVREVLIAGKVAYEVRSGRWDLVVVDAAPTGQVLSHIRGPRTLGEMVGVGAIRSQAEWVQAILEDTQRSGMVVVALPEEMPVTETEELLRLAPKEVGTPVVALVANRVVLPPAHRDELRAVAGSGVAGLDLALQAAALLAEIAEHQEPYLERLRHLGPPVVEVPSLPDDRLLDEVVAHLA